MIRKTAAEEAPRLKWFKSSYSDSSDGHDCVEVAASPGAVHVRDSKDLSVPELAFGETAWTGFVSYASDC
ncbi:DUF397 domain-containing protein [Streptomyces sp. NBC_00441]|uniref:DUF397 domain-containing protein n=1 Tax=Streptomyces sp. NBC_00441 TaxID=2975742 RepID=UPI002E2B1B0A|nr:DUF397 domain-containing protein [Streptomyces sp. NBC_00441]